MVLKIVEKVETMSEPWVAFEFFPPRTTAGLDNLYKRLDKLQKHGEYNHHYHQS